MLGLAPAAHGANRTGRMFTGDRSGDWLFRSLHRAGLASQPTSTHRDDGLTLVGVWVTAAGEVRTAGQSARRADEQERCRPFLEREIAVLRAGGGGIRVVLCLGALAFAAACDAVRGPPRPAVRARRRGHGPDDGPTLVCSFHPSQQNTFTGRLTEAMLDAVCARAAELARRDAGVQRRCVPLACRTCDIEPRRPAPAACSLPSRWAPLVATGCTGSTPSDKRVALDIVETMGEDFPGGTLTDEQQQCMTDKIDGYTEAELEAIGNAPENLALDPTDPSSSQAEGTPELQAFVADLQECTGEGTETPTSTSETGSTTDTSETGTTTARTGTTVPATTSATTEG